MDKLGKDQEFVNITYYAYFWILHFIGFGCRKYL